MLLVYQFFRELRPKQALRVEPVSLTANFLFCVSTVAAATFVYLCGGGRAASRRATSLVGGRGRAGGDGVPVSARDAGDDGDGVRDA